MNASNNHRFPFASAALLVSSCLLGGLNCGLALAEELPSFTRVTPAQPAATATARREGGLVEFQSASTPKTTPVRPSPSAAGRTSQPQVTQALVQPRTARQPAAPVSTKHKKDELLNFTPTTSSVAANAIPAPRPASTPAVTAPVTAPGAAKPPTTSSVARAAEQQVHSVSALSLAALPPRIAARRGEGNTILGPSEFELRDIFNRAVEAAIDRAPTIERAKAEQQATEEDIAEARGQRYPQVDVGTQTSPVKFGKGSDEDSGSGGINLAVTTPVYDWGRIRNTIDSRKHLSKAADESLEAEKETLGYEVVTTMIELGKQRIIVDLSQQFADRMSELVKMLAGIVAVDQGRSSELTQAKARLLQAQALRDSANAKARDAEITLSKLVGERPVAIPRTKEWNIRLANLDLLLDDAKEHPTIRQSIAETESAELQAKAVRAGGLPQLNWVVSKSTAEDSLGREQPWQTNLSMTWGAFRGGSTRAAERAALQRAEASRFETDQQRRDLEFRIRTADHDARTLLERSELYRELSVESSRIREDFFQQWHHLGRRTLLDVLTAENEHYGNQVNEINNRFDGYQAIFRQYAGAGTLARWLRTGS
ncbi:outer membrane channel protein [compost metagenome]